MQRDPFETAAGWPPCTVACRPWTRWWWPGSAVTEAEIVRHLELFRQAGFGGVEISPIYSVTGEDERSIRFLSPAWFSLLRFTVQHARRLGLDVDMITGSGWPFGGPWVSAADAAASCSLASYTLDQGASITEPISYQGAPQAMLQALMAFSADGHVLDLSTLLDAQQQLNWSAPTGQWRLYALFQAGTGQQVKRAAPGGEGYVLDHFSHRALANYLATFDQAFAELPPADQVRCFFNDSYEVYEANWTADLLGEFERRRGYDLRRYLPALFGQDTSDLVRRVRSDYRQTIGDLLLETFVEPWTAWAHRHGTWSRNQAHGSPGNLLDLYAAADIPETETFGPDWVRLAGLAPMPGTPPQQGGRADVLIGKLASSAAHVAGKRLCSSESFTWLDEHGKVPLAHMKAELDVAFVMGVNHVFFHGTPYSPAGAEWPGWMFYATTHVAPTNPFWRDLAELNGYISRCQSFLQAGEPDNDLLVYLPIFDLWAAEHGAEHMLHFLSVHAEHWLDDNLPTFTATMRWLWDHGYSFDFVSDQLLERAITVVGQQLRAGGAAYRALLLVGCEVIPPRTLERIVELARAGATVLLAGELPSDVPGLGGLAQRREQLAGVLSQLGPLAAEVAGVSSSDLGTGRLLRGQQIQALLDAAAIPRETVVDAEIEVIRRRDDHDYIYFLANLGAQPLDQWVSLAVHVASASIFDPASARHGVAQIRAQDGVQTQVYLQLEPGETVVLRTSMEPTHGPAWQYLAPAGQPEPIAGTWHVEFIAGGPTLPRPTEVAALTSWTEWAGDSEALRSFAGTARYTIWFEKPGAGEHWALELGTVCHSARVKLNGQDLGAIYARPYRMVLPDGTVTEGRNRLEIEVTNLMANRLADLDRRKIAWRRFFFVNIAYQPFDAAGWEPLPSGLLGPVHLVPLGRLESE